MYLANILFYYIGPSRDSKNNIIEIITLMDIIFKSFNCILTKLLNELYFNLIIIQIYPN